MAFTVIAKKRFENKVKKLLEYFVVNWQDQVTVDFLLNLYNTITIISNNPAVGSKIIHSNNIRSLLVTKHNKLYYRVEKNKIILLNLIDTRRNPKNNPFKKTA